MFIPAPTQVILPIPLPVNSANLTDFAKGFLASKLNMTTSDFALASTSTDGTLSQVYLDHVVQGFKVLNHNSQVNFSNHSLLSYSASFNNTYVINPCTPMDTESVKRKAELIYKGRAEKLSEVLVDVGGHKLVRSIKMDISIEGEIRYQAALDECSGTVVSFVNYVTV